MDCSLRTADAFPVVGSLPPKNSGLLITRKIYKLFTYPQCIIITLTKLITKFIYMYSLIQYVLISIHVISTIGYITNSQWPPLQLA